MLGEAPDTFTDPVDAVKAQRAKSGDPEKPVSDQFLDPFVIVDAAGAPVGTVQVCTVQTSTSTTLALSLETRWLRFTSKFRGFRTYFVIACKHICLFATPWNRVDSKFQLLVAVHGSLA